MQAPMQDSETALILVVIEHLKHRAGQGWAGQGRAGQGRAGQGRAIDWQGLTWKSNMKTWKASNQTR